MDKRKDQTLYAFLAYPNPSCWPGPKTDAYCLFPPSRDTNICRPKKEKKKIKCNTDGSDENVAKQRKSCFRLVYGTPMKHSPLYCHKIRNNDVK